MRFVHAALVLVAAIPERVSLRNVLFSRDGFLFLLDFHAGREGHGIHQPPGSFTGSSATRLLERLRDLHKVRDVVSEVTDVRQGVHGPTRCFRPSALGFGKRHPGEEILFDFRPRLHARELAFRKRGRRIPDVAAQFLGGLAQFLREFLDERRPRRPSPRFFFVSFLFVALASLFELVHGGGDEFGGAVGAGFVVAVVAAGADEGVGVGFVFRRVVVLVRTVVCVLLFALRHFQQLIHLVLQLPVDRS
mmetsp:Transcript_11370/g.42170  ORF Transcript_11370/g.42170 Transcript_11370/m.42170 type:complete len:248 (+) Transcript_11370:2105-2848(+)